MAQAVTAYSTPAFSAADINTAINGEPRILDVRLGEALGFALPRMIRKLIRRHLATLEQFGKVCATWNKPSDRGGRPSQTYWLSKRQALFITAKSDTERAALVTVQMVEVFDAVTGGAAPARIPVKAHTRSRPKGLDFDKARPGRGCVVLDRPVYFDAERRPKPGELALVIWQTGRISVEPMLEEHPDVPEAWVPGPAYVWVLKPGRLLGTLRCREKVTLIGAVVTATGRPAPPRLMH
ncbi:MAG: hypothetical protein WAP03_22090 [Methylorubrum rhodinum]|uniref:hypothetical protein n=1 Tax=Methylorubrum rhodinum TaxID=29428 RepID=UPI003BAF9A26